MHRVYKDGTVVLNAVCLDALLHVGQPGFDSAQTPIHSH